MHTATGLVRGTPTRTGSLRPSRARSCAYATVFSFTGASVFARVSPAWMRSSRVKRERRKGQTGRSSREKERRSRSRQSEKTRQGGQGAASAPLHAMPRWARAEEATTRQAAIGARQSGITQAAAGAPPARTSRWGRATRRTPRRNHPPR